MGEKEGSNIPVIDLQSFPSQYEKLRGACEEWGCFRVSNHRISEALTGEMKAVARSLLDLPMEAKKRNEDQGVEGSGYIEPNKASPLFESLGLYDMGSAQAVDVFCSQLNASPLQRLEREKMTKLQSPNFHVSRTRLVIYNLPKSMTEKELKKLCFEAVTSRATKQKPVIRQAKHLCLAMARTAILERRPVTMVAKSIDVLVTSCSNSFKTGYFKGTKAEKAQASGAASATIHGTGANVSRSDTTGKSVEREYVAGLDGESFERLTSSETDSDENGNTGYVKSHSNGTGSKLLLGAETQRTGGQTSLHSGNVGANYTIVRSTSQPEPQVTSPAISPDEMYTYVFAPVEEEMAGDPSYLVAVIVEFLRSCNLERIKVRPNIYALTARLLARNERYAELGLFIINKILEPSKEVAWQLLESGRHNRQTRKLGLDMLRQLFLHDDYVVFLVQDGYYLEALRYMKKHKVTTVRPSMFLEAAFASSDSQHLAAVLRFFLDYIPGSRSSTDHNTYYHLLNEMNTAAA